MFIRLIRTILKKIIYFLIFPSLLGATVFYLTKDQKKSFSSQMTISSGISSRKSSDMGEDVRLDFYSANNAMDNIINIIKSRKTIEDASLRLLSMHLSQKEPNDLIINKESLNELKTHIDNKLWQTISVEGNSEQTQAKIVEYMAANPSSVFHYLLRSHPHYSIESILKNLSVQRKQSSDMIDISYNSDDAGICFGTLNAITVAFMNRYKMLKGNENKNAIIYFQRQLDMAYARLQESENSLKQFIAENKILNYYEQGKSLDIYKKEVEQEEQNAQRIASGADASLRKLESKLAVLSQRSITVDSLATMRDQVTNLRMSLNSLMLDKVKNSTEITETRNKITQLNEIISSKISSIHNNDFSIGGVSSTRILDEWLTLYIERERQLNGVENIMASKSYVEGRIEAFAPLGAELNKREREVKVNEGQYLSILHGLNLANLQMQNLEMANNQSIIDEPFFPNTPKSGSRMILVIAAFLLGNIMLVGYFLAKILLDTSLRNSDNARVITGLRTIASYPYFRKVNTSITKLIDMVSTQLASELLVAKNSLTHSKTLKVAIYQTYATDGADFLASTLLQKLKEMEVHSTAFAPVGTKENGIDVYELTPSISSNCNWNEFIKTSPAISICVIPFLKANAIAAKIVNEADVILLSINSKRNWTSFDTHSLEMIKETTHAPIYLVLNKVDTDNLKDYFGQIPVKSLIGRNRRKYE